MLPSGNDAAHALAEFFGGLLKKESDENEIKLRKEEAERAKREEERAALAMRETRMVTGIEVMQSPITALYQAFSKKERSKRWVAEQEYKDDQERIVKELLRNYVAYEIIELSDEEFESFIYFLNMDDVFLKTATEMELITFIKDKFEHYQWLKENQ